MQIPRTLTRSVLLVSVFLLATTLAHAASLYGKVDKVDEGDVITMNNLNRSIKIRLLGIDAPEREQAFAEVSRQHLSDLILNKFVVVHYSGLGEKNQILGRVVLSEMDVCAQMIRDGVAWYATSDRNLLSQTERETYGASEQLAREERRGLWEDESPVAPWNFKNTVAVNAPAQTISSKRTGASGLTSEDLMTAVSGGPGSKLSGPAGEPYSAWRTLSPEGFDFSISVPGNAREGGSLIPTSNGKTAEINAAFGSDGPTGYLVFWGKGPAYGNSDDAATEAVKGLIHGLNRGLQARGVEATLNSKPQRKLKIGPLSGWQYQLSGPGLSGIVRALSKQSRSEMHVFVLAVFNGSEQDETVSNFLNSVKLNK